MDNALLWFSAAWMELPELCDEAFDALLATVQGCCWSLFSQWIRALRPGSSLRSDTGGGGLPPGGGPGLSITSGYICYPLPCASHMCTTWLCVYHFFLNSRP